MSAMEISSRVRQLAARVTNGCDTRFSIGSMSPTIYDTAWVSLVLKPDVGYLFPECFEYILFRQLSDGTWPTYASPIDGILNTAAALLALKRHVGTRTARTQELYGRIQRATKSLQSLLDSWDVASTLHVGFEILVPSLLDYLDDEGLHFTFNGKKDLYAMRAQKLDKFEPRFLYLSTKSTALHSLEAFIGKIDFDSVRHHKVAGAFMASPSSTAAFLMHASVWDDECEEYLRHVMVYGPGIASGGMPSAYPSPVFEMTWTLSTLLESNIDLQAIAPRESNAAVEYLTQVLLAENGLAGFAPYVGADADDTAKTILTLNLLGKPTDAGSLLREFEGPEHFKTYRSERDPSFSANCNVLITLLHASRVSEHVPQIRKAVHFLCSVFHSSDMVVQDKWNLSPYYSYMLMLQACVRLMQVVQSGALPSFPCSIIAEDVVPILARITEMTLASQNFAGSWGPRGLVEESAYAVLALAYTLRIPQLSDLHTKARASMTRGRQFLLSDKSYEVEHLWIEKVTYGSAVLSETYLIAALTV